MRRLWVRKLRGVSGSWKEAVCHTRRDGTHIYPLTRSGLAQRGREPPTRTAEGAKAAFSEVMGGDTETLFGRCMTCGRVTKPGPSPREGSAVRDEGQRDGDEAAIALENHSLRTHCRSERQIEPAGSGIRAQSDEHLPRKVRPGGWRALRCVDGRSTSLPSKCQGRLPLFLQRRGVTTYMPSSVSGVQVQR